MSDLKEFSVALTLNDVTCEENGFFQGFEKRLKIMDKSKSATSMMSFILRASIKITPGAHIKQ